MSKIEYKRFKDCPNGPSEGGYSLKDLRTIAESWSIDTDKKSKSEICHELQQQIKKEAPDLLIHKKSIEKRHKMKSRLQRKKSRRTRSLPAAEEAWASLDLEIPSTKSINQQLKKLRTRLTPEDPVTTASMETYVDQMEDPNIGELESATLTEQGKHEFIDYPGFGDPDFYGKISNKWEYLNNATSLKTEKEKTAQYFPHQVLLRNYISPDTPYERILLYHETGTGKTCSAIAIAEGFLESQNHAARKIFVLVPGPSTMNNFQSELMSKCTTNKYHTFIRNYEKL